MVTLVVGGCGGTVGVVKMVSCHHGLCIEVSASFSKMDSPGNTVCPLTYLHNIGKYFFS